MDAQLPAEFSDALIEALPGLFFVVDRNGVLVRWNENHRLLLGYSDEDLASLSSGYDLFVDPVSVRAIAERERGIERKSHYVASLKTKDKREIPCEFNVVRHQINDDWFTIGTAFDLTQRRETERHLAEQRQQLTLLQRIAVISETATVLGHELVQPISAIANNANAALTMLENASCVHSEVCASLHDIVRLAQQSGDIIRQVRGFLAKGPNVKTEIGLNELVESTLHLASADLTARGISIRSRLLPFEVSLRTFPVQIQQVLMNLVNNAADALQHAGQKRRRICVTLSRKAGEINVEVADNGPGIAPEIIDRLFQPFVGNKPGGLGLGLTICRNIVESLGGSLKAENGAKGAVFTMSLPLIQDDAA